MKYYLLILTFLSITLCQELNNEINKFNFHPSYLTSNYTIDFIRNIKPQKCYSNEECPHYSNGCAISAEMFLENSILLNDDRIENFSKEELISYGIYGICSYHYYCTENKDNTTQNSNCIVIETDKTSNPDSYKSPNDITLDSYNLKPGFNKNNITSPYHCNENSIKDNHCNSKLNISCQENNNCLSKNCGKNFQCLDSKNFYIYRCQNGKDRENNITTICKKVDHEYCNKPMECLSNFSVNGYCLERDEYDKVHRNDKRNRILTIGIGLIIILILILIGLWVYFKKIFKSCFSNEKH